MKIAIKGSETDVWVLNEDGVFECSHESYHWEDEEAWPLGPWDTSVHYYKVAVCDDCGADITDDVGDWDPGEDDE